MYKKTKYCCDTCGYEYETEKEALACEQSGYPEGTADIKVGDEVHFNREVPTSDGGGVASPLVTYKLYSGKVLYKYCMFNRRKAEHEEVLIVSFKEGEVEGEEVDMECQVMLLDIEGQGLTLFSPYQMGKFHPGFAEMFKKKREELRAANN